MRFEKFYKIYTEGNRNRNVVVVDVQPSYSGIFDGNENPLFEEIISFVNQQNSDTLMFVNAEDQGLTTDTVSDIMVYWTDSGFQKDWDTVEIIDKGYGYLRSWMDQGVSDKSIQKAIRIMYQKKISDSREIVEDMDDSVAAERWREILNDGSIPDDMIAVNWLSVSKLKAFSPFYLVGGARDECLKEVELMLNAFNIRYKRIDSLIY
jgi:hypothetical protein